MSSPGEGADPSRAGAPRRGWAVEAMPLAAIAAQLVVLACVIRVLHIESVAFYDWVVPMAFGGWLVHHLLPRRWRLPAFVVLSLAAIMLVFRRDAAWVIGIGVLLIGLARLPVRNWIRVALVVVAGGGLAALRAEWVPGPVPAAVWPILGSMFMFRLLAYLYDAAHAKERPTWTEAFAYFFCLPNVAFPLFPVIDFATFRRTYYDRPAPVIYQQGIAWMVRGVSHLVLYRLVYQYGTLSPSDVESVSDLVRYILANFALYLRVSGQFHLVVGMLHLFGFRLPETHRFFYLASSFTDFWRRINIYWKEFMQKVVFNPTYFPLRKRWGDTTALVVSTLAVFFATWFFHSYQWFWLLGTWLWSLTDTLFWAILAVLLVANVLRETRRGRARSLGGPQRTTGAALGVALRTAGTFTVLALLWTLWTSPTLSDFVAVMSVDVVDAAGVFLGLAVLTGIGMAAVITTPWAAKPRASRSLRPEWAPAIALAALVLVWAAGTPGISRRFSDSTRGVLRDIRLAELNRQDAARLQRGYYENIVGVNRFNGQLWEVYSKRSATQPTLPDLGILLETSDEHHTMLAPLAGAVINGASLRTNSWGMRDREYAEVPPPNTYRISLLGQSYVMGMGVGDGETFETLIEDRLNSARGEFGGTRFEILNFAAPRYSLVQQWYAMTRGRVLNSSPRAVVVVGHEVDLGRIGDYLIVELRRRAITFEPLRVVADSAGITRGMKSEDIHRRLKSYGPALIERVLGMMAVEIRSRGAIPVYAYIPMPLDKPQASVVDGLLAAARRAGFDTIDLRDVFAGTNGPEIVVAEWDRHPNPRGHLMIANQLYGPLLESLGIKSDSSTARAQTVARP